MGVECKCWQICLMWEINTELSVHKGLNISKKVYLNPLKLKSNQVQLTVTTCRGKCNALLIKLLIEFDWVEINRKVKNKIHNTPLLPVHYAPLSVYGHFQITQWETYWYNQWIMTWLVRINMI